MRDQGRPALALAAKVRAAAIHAPACCVARRARLHVTPRCQLHCVDMVQIQEARPTVLPAVTQRTVLPALTPPPGAAAACCAADGAGTARLAAPRLHGASAAAAVVAQQPVRLPGCLVAEQWQLPGNGYCHQDPLQPPLPTPLPLRAAVAAAASAAACGSVGACAAAGCCALSATPLPPQLQLPLPDGFAAGCWQCLHCSSAVQGWKWSQRLAAGKRPPCA